MEVEADSILATAEHLAAVLYLDLFQLQAVAEVLDIMIVIQNQVGQAVVVVDRKLMHTAGVVVVVQEAVVVIADQQLTQEMNQQYKAFLDKEILAVTDTTTAAVLVVQAVQELLLQLAAAQLHEPEAVAVHHG